jgi:adenylate kinase family enzyme/Ca2+-binding EF-hand superfamily protein
MLTSLKIKQRITGSNLRSVGTNWKASIDSNVIKNLFLSFAVDTKNSTLGGPYPVLNKDGIFGLLKSVGVTISAAKVDELLQTINKEKAKDNPMLLMRKSEELDYEDFRAHYKYILKQGSTNYERDLREIFDLIDKRNRGYFTSEDLIGALTTSGKITEEEAEGIIRSVDRNDDQKIEFHEFTHVMEKNPVFCWKLLSLFRVVFVTGGPASGKGTICDEIVKKANIKIRHVSSGDLLRKEVESGSILGKTIAETIKKGKLCDASVVITLLKKTLLSSPGILVLLDGFPRSLENAKDFVEQFGMGECCIVFQCPHEVMISRILERGKTSGRLDDNLETAKKRIAIYEAQSKEPLEYFNSLGSKMHYVDSTLPVEQNVKNLLQLDIFSAATNKKLE